MSRDQLRYAEWARLADERGPAPVVPAATVVLLRDTDDGLQTLMLRKNSAIAFGGMWVFPGGRIDDVDRLTDDFETTARAAAAREAHEEAGVLVSPDEFAWFAHWVPPPIAPRRYATWFFATVVEHDEVVIDGGEIHEHAWMSPADALRRCDELAIELAPPTWVTLHYLAVHDDAAAAHSALDAVEPRFYETHIGKLPEGPVAMWAGDAGYDSWDPTVAGPRHRLVMIEGDYRFDDSGAA